MAVFHGHALRIVNLCVKDAASYFETPKIDVQIIK
jgi:hypothetical protein